VTGDRAVVLGDDDGAAAADRWSGINAPPRLGRSSRDRAAMLGDSEGATVVEIGEIWYAA
jgi:hypothetical protein